jgi:hypothetical protein
MKPEQDREERGMQTNYFFLIGALAIAGCASSQAAREPATTPPTAEERGMRGEMMHQGMAGMCPMQVEGTSATAEDVEGGAALAFTTTGDVAELRRRVAHMADMHNRHGGAKQGHAMGMHSHQIKVPRIQVTVTTAPRHRVTRLAAEECMAG